jgi:hypothetical protein
MFINNKELIEISLFYKKIEKTGMVKIARKIEDVEEAQRKDYSKVTFKMKPINWQIYNNLQRSALVDKGTGEGDQIDWIKYKETKLIQILADWDAKGADGSKMPINQETIFNLHPAIAESLLNEYDKKTVLGEE